MDDLVKRLRRKEIPGAIYEGTDENGPYVSFEGVPDPLCVAAADRIEAQAAEIERLTAKKDALLRAASTSRMAFAGHVSFETAINQLDAALGDAQ